MGYITPTGSLSIPTTVVYNGTTYSVTEIDRGTFSECNGLISVTIPNTITSIGSRAFAYNSGLTSITIPTSITSIGEGAFRGCINMNQVNWNAKNVTDYPLYNPGTTTEFPFVNCFSLSSVVFGDSVQTIPAFAFCDTYSNLDSITIGNSVVSIGGRAFYRIDSGGRISVNYTGTISQWCKIDFSAYSSYSWCSFYNLSINGEPLTDLVVPSDVTKIKANSFRYCNSLSTLFIPNSVTEIDELAFASCGLNTITISNSVTSIGTNAFSGCSYLTSITIPKSVTYIGDRAFYNCSRLASVHYNAENAAGGMHYWNAIPRGPFSSCDNLTTIHIGADVKEIDANMFRSCTGVHLVVALGSTPATLVGGAFADFADNSILMVSCGKRLTYFSVWNMFAFDNIIEDCGEYSISMSGVGVGGNITASATNAQMGQEVRLTVSPNEGMMLSSISVCNATDPMQIIPVYPVGKANSTYGFIMPPFGVSVMATFVAGTSVNENDNVSVSVYPNPTSGQVRIEAEGLKHIGISNMIGQQILEGEANGDVFEYNFGKHDAGVYLVRIETTNGIAVKKVLVMR